MTLSEYDLYEQYQTWLTPWASAHATNLTLLVTGFYNLVVASPAYVYQHFVYMIQPTKQ